MSGADILADTNVLIYAMEEHPAVKGLNLCAPAISVVSEIELLGKKGIPNKEATAIRELLSGYPIVPLSEDIKEIAILLKQKYSIKTPDAIIAATAKFLDLMLVTADKDFSRIEEIDVVLLTL
ncbi:MAG: type II toxin-antitoxin system VapC family toxin [Prevotellaceae bacterium]|jgi:predicted nucleic acid-binding protein|nr:type II toxin-antitoxin system VapC family toxin [Prevotellaceae bacterium]